MNLANLVESKNKDNVYYFPSKATTFQSDINELILKLHKSHLIKCFTGTESNVDAGTELSDQQVLKLLLHNLNCVAFNPYLLIDHYIPKNMLLMNTKESLKNVSGKFTNFNKIIDYYESLNNESRKYNVLVLANNTKELDFVESLLTGRFVNYERYAGTKLFEKDAGSKKSKKHLNNDESDTGEIIGSGINDSKKKEDPYLIKRLSTQEKKLRKYLKNNNSHDYCLTVHLITINQLKFQFFTNKPDHFDFLDYNNFTKFDYIIDFNNNSNLEHFYLRKLRTGFLEVHGKKNRLIKYPQLLPIIRFISFGSISHSALLLGDEIYKKLKKQDHIDENVTKLDLVLDDMSVLKKIIENFLVLRYTKKPADEFASDFSPDFEKWFKNCEFHNGFNPKDVVLNDFEIKEIIKESLDKFDLKYYDINMNQEIFKQIDTLVNKCCHEYDKYLDSVEKTLDESQMKKLNIIHPSSVLLNSDGSVSKKRKLETSFSTETATNLELLKNEFIETLKSFRQEYEKEEMNNGDHFDDFENYKKQFTRLVKIRSLQLIKLTDFYKLFLNLNNVLGNYVQILMENNNSNIKSLYKNELDLDKGIMRKEKVFERLNNEIIKMTKNERLLLTKLNSFREYSGKDKLGNIEELYSAAKLDPMNKNEFCEVDEKLEEQLEIEAILKEDKVTTERQNALIEEVEQEIKERQDKIETLSGKIDESRVKYQEKSAVVGQQITRLEDLNAKIKKMDEILQNKEKFKLLKEKSLYDGLFTTSITTDTEPDKNNGKDTDDVFINESKYTNVKLKNLEHQQIFLQSYMELLKQNLISDKKDKVRKGKQGSSS